MASNSLLNNYDPEKNFFNNIDNKSRIFLPNELNLLNDSNHTSSILHINCRSVFNKLCELNIFLSSCNLQPDFPIICLTETWLNESTAPLISLPGYNFVYKNRLDKLGGGTGLFIKNDIHFISHEDYNANNDTCENLCIEIVNKNFRNILLFVIYRPPNSNPTLFLEY